jgi:hypothetical protein
MAIREASANDNADLIDLVKSTPMDGLISLRIEREPDYFRLLSLRGEGKVFVATIMNRIVGAISVTYKIAHINGKPRKIGYIGDLRVYPEFSGSRIILNLLYTLLEYSKSIDVDIYFCVAAKGNKKVKSLFEGRFNFPPFYSVGDFYVYQILPLPYYRRQTKYKTTRASKDDLNEVSSILNNFNNRLEFSPFFSNDDLAREMNTLSEYSESDFFITKNTDTILAALSIFDTSLVKSNVVIRMPSYLRSIISLLNITGKIIPIPPLPKTGEAVNILYIRHLSCRSNASAALKSLLLQVCKLAFRRRYSFVTVAFHERDPMRRLVRFLPRFTFISEGFVTSLRGDTEVIKNIRNGIPLEDFSLV